LKSNRSPSGTCVVVGRNEVTTGNSNSTGTGCHHYIERANPSKYSQAAGNFDEVASWGWIVGKESITTADLGENLQFDERKAQRIVKKLVEVGLLKRIGAGKSTTYEVRNL